MRNFFTWLGIFSLFTAGLLIAWQQMLPARYQSSLFWAIWSFFVFTTGLIHYVLVKAAERDPKRFVGYYMGITAIKLFGYLLVIVAYALVKREAALGFALWFLALYLLYSGFEVVMLLRQFRRS